jgi:hypothetical protein
MTIFDEIQASIAGLAENAGSSVVGIGQRWAWAPASCSARDGC